MIWVFAAASWMLVAVVVGLLVGNGIRLERGPEADSVATPSAPREREPARTATGRTDDVVTAAAG